MNENKIISKMKMEDEFYLKKIKYEFFKRIFDIILSFIGGIITVPIIFVICIIVRIESKGFPIYCQKRLGKNGKVFTMYKIRSMYYEAEKISGPIWAIEDDKRITKVGKFIRKTRIDELPQLFNIILGDMSIVGPRPEREILHYEFEKIIPEFAIRLWIKPGLTGLAQVNGGYRLTPEEKFHLDIKYIKYRNFFLDIKIILKTIIIVFTGEGAR